MGVAKGWSNTVSDYKETKIPTKSTTVIMAISPKKIAPKLNSPKQPPPEKDKSGSIRHIRGCWRHYLPRVPRTAKDPYWLVRGCARYQISWHPAESLNPSPTTQYVPVDGPCAYAARRHGHIRHTWTAGVPGRRKVGK